MPRQLLRKNIRSSTGSPSQFQGRARFTLLSLVIGCILSFQIGFMAKDNSFHGRELTVAPGGDGGTLDDLDRFAMAKRESFGFFDDVPNNEWQLLKDKVRDIYPNVLGGNPEQLRSQPINANRFFQDDYEPDFACRHERRIGRLGDGGKWVCDPHRLQAKSTGSSLATTSTPPPCLVYSVGSNGDTSFEAAVKQEIGTHCEIHSFDMANYTEVVEAAGANFHQWGISGSSRTDNRGRLYKTLEETVKELGHEGRVIDIFKIDCEGCEWDTYPSFFTAGVELRQVLIELHGNKKNRDDKFAQIPAPKGIDFFQSMYEHGYVIFHKEVNIRFWHFGQCIEYAFVKLHRDFFQGIPGFPAISSTAS